MDPNKYYGKYRGFVVDNEDPEKRGRLRLRVPSALAGEVTAWALPCAPFGGSNDQGFFMMPVVGAQVWAEFEEGNLDYPIWSGTFWQSSGEAPVENPQKASTTRLLRTPSGHSLQFDDEAGAESFLLTHPSGTEIRIDEKGTIEIKGANGEQLTLDAAANISLSDSNNNELSMNSSGVTVKDASGNQIEMAGSGITIKGSAVTIDAGMVSLGGSGGEPLMKGTSLLSWLASHTHNCTAPGTPSGPPVPPPTPALLTTKTTAN
ncbi:phage baseplate assembly protein V [Haloferula chungangensis]|uniref:Phage baseplate assembly protein V n=1 Tax=Haloferula chungangensis TaxID=1048331 RepID=A0ABW2L3C9_9BACT